MVRVTSNYVALPIDHNLLFFDKNYSKELRTEVVEFLWKNKLKIDNTLNMRWEDIPLFFVGNTKVEDWYKR
jgi:hypothetical protein